MEVDGGTVTFTVHNIGTADAPGCTAELQVPDGSARKAIASISCSALPRPADLTPSTAQFTIKVRESQLAEGFRIALDPLDRIYEICERNNGVEVR